MTTPVFGNDGADPAASQLLSIGLDCCGLCALWHAVKRLGVSANLVFASDSAWQVRTQVMATHPPMHWYDDVLTRNVTTVPSVALYGAGFPCQPFSSAGARAGLSDPRGIVFFAIAAYIDVHRPKAFVLENVNGLLNQAGGDTFRTILGVLQAIGAGTYELCHETLNTERHGVPQHRPRVFIVGRLRSAAILPFAFPTSLAPVSLDALLEPADRLHDMDTLTPALPAGARSNLSAALRKLRSQGHDPANTCFVVDIHASLRFQTIMKDRCPCLLKSRPRCYFVTHRNRMLTLLELFRLQGYSEMQPLAVSPRIMGGMLGNSMSINVIERL
jgi:DNA-cytosine methyltransferase